MNSPDKSQLNNGKADLETLEHLLGVIVENRDQRCNKALELANIKAKAIIRQTHARVRERTHHHIIKLREKQSERVSAARARNQSLLRNQHHKQDKALLDDAWPMLREALKALWKEPSFRNQWLSLAKTSASSTLLSQDWTIEHAADTGVAEQQNLRQLFTNNEGKNPELRPLKSIEAGVRIAVDNTVVDATLDGLLQHKSVILSLLIARIKKEISTND